MANLPERAGRLVELESVISAGLADFVAVGEALVEIRDAGLYLASHRSFAAYCRDRWGLSPAAAWRQMGQARATATLPAGSPIPSQRALARTRRLTRPTITVTSTDTAPDPGPVRLPRLGAVLASMDALPSEIAAGVADDDSYRRIVRWAHNFQATYQTLHPRAVAAEPTPAKPTACDHPMSRRSKGVCMACGQTITKR